MRRNIIRFGIAAACIWCAVVAAVQGLPAYRDLQQSSIQVEAVRAALESRYPGRDDIRFMPELANARFAAYQARSSIVDTIVLGLAVPAALLFIVGVVLASVQRRRA